MDIKVGNTVFVIDEDFSGIVKKIDGLKVTFSCDDGFEYTYFKDQLIVIDEDGNASHEVKAFKQTKHSTILPKLVEANPTSFFENSIKFKGKKPEFDLHIEEIAHKKKFSTKHEALLFQLDYVRHIIHLAYRRRIPRIVFVHGVGKGVLREELRKMLRHDYPNVEYFDGAYQKFGSGATEIIIHGLGKL